MPRVKILLFASLRDKYGVKEIEVDTDGSLRNAVENASKQLGREFIDEFFENSSYRSDRLILVNGRHIQFLGEVQLKDGDIIAIFPPIAGG
ncbi:MAG: MoaD/ThiS family protein [Infirmifilum sp.]|jgi:molybdopterin synthase sulfur carrier subunit|uniref:MoaD family protein n=1 Tax=Infirmifilum uzonense TaxID=1550241 RepID=A0A0F7CKQ8_9CREN|nr:MoaD family protein [Infirmifilum uzonense]AKG38086.1 MoaD family protein [Infirmifilum uzonense]